MSASTIPLWGRAWKLTVKYLSGDNLETTTVITQETWTPEALRMTFEVLENNVGSPYWFADISIFNLDISINGIGNKLFNAMWVTLEAGFQNGPSKSSVIWDGPVLQTLFDRENVVDFRITLHCLATIAEIENNIVSTQVPPLTTQAQAVQQMMQSIDGPRVVFSPLAQNTLNKKNYPRGKTFFGSAKKYLSEAASDNFMTQWQNGTQAYISETSPQGSSPKITYAPPYPPNYTAVTLDPSVTYSLIGTPRQTPFGVNFTVLLDPRLHVGLPPMLVRLNNVVISQMKTHLGSILNPVDSSGLCVVAQVRHIGDTRGNDWTTEVTAMWRNYTTNLLNGVFNALSSGVSK